MFGRYLGPKEIRTKIQFLKNLAHAWRLVRRYDMIDRVQVELLKFEQIFNLDNST